MAKNDNKYKKRKADFVFDQGLKDISARRSLERKRIAIEEEKKFRKSLLDVLMAEGRTSPTVLAAQEQRATHEGDRPFQKQKALGELLTGISGATRTGMSFIDWMKPFIIGALLLFFLIGPGVAAIITLFRSINPFIIIGFVFVGVLIWRNR